MKTWRIVTVGGLLTLATIINGADLMQETAEPSDAFSDIALQPIAPVAVPDSIVQITAEAQGLGRVPTEQVPRAGTFWLVQPGLSHVVAPMPCPPDDLSLPIYAIGPDGQFLVDGTVGDAAVATPSPIGRLATTSRMEVTLETALEQQVNAVINLISQVLSAAAPTSLRTMSMSVSSVPGFGDTGDGTNTVTYNANSYSAPDYGTNLWLATVGITNGSLSAIASNTLPDVTYLIQSRTNLLQTDWQAEFPILGSETTNWTPFSVPQNNRTNLFLRLQSWISSDGSGLPDWWQLLYFGQLGIDPYGNPAGDGWSNYQKFQNGWNPNQFYTPAAPQLAVSYNVFNGQANVSWTPVLTPPTSYTLKRFLVQDAVCLQTTTYNLPGSTNNYPDNISVAYSQPWTDNSRGPGDQTYYQIQAHYAVGDSAWSDPAYMFPATSAVVSLVPGPQNAVYLAVGSLPPGTATLRLSRVDLWTVENWNDYSDNVTNDIPVSASTNGLYLLPASITGSPTDKHGYAYYWWYVDLVNGNGQVMGYPTFISSGFITRFVSESHDWITLPYFDGRQQLKQNLVFLLRAATKEAPFQFTDHHDSAYFPSFTNQNNFVIADFFRANNPGYNNDFDIADFNPFLPFVENNLFRNFVFTLPDADAGLGRLTTGVAGSYYDNTPTPLRLEEPATYRFSLTTTNGGTIPALLPVGNTRWLCSYPLDTSALGEADNGEAYSPFLGEIGITASSDATWENIYYAMATAVSNYWGLPFLSANIAYPNGAGTAAAATVLNAGQQVDNVGGFFYPETAQPQFQTVEYDFWYRAFSPESPDFSTTNTSGMLFASVGKSIGVNGYAKLAVGNGYPGVYAYLGQYFDTAYKMTNGVASSTPTGVLSPYGNFFATEPGPAALVTMPDIDPPYQRGTCTVYSVSTVIDRSQGSNMDLAFNGANATSINNPAQIWVNDNYDRWHDVDCTPVIGGNCDSEQDDLGPVDIAKLPAEQAWPDSQYTISGFPAIPSTRDLEDYFRLWLPGVAAVMKVMPSDYSVKLTLSGDGQIRIFRATEADGGTNYLFNTVTASNQVNNSISLYVGLLSANSPIYFLTQTNFNEHFIFCGAHTGSAQVDLQVLDGNGNVVADAPAYLQIKNIKEMYERWTVGDRGAITPTNTARLAVEDLPTGVPSFQYAQPTSTNTPYILHVHGWNMERWEKDRYGEAMFKRLYWQGYQGRFGIFRWPTLAKFPAVYGEGADLNHFDKSEFNAWKSGAPLCQLLAQLNREYPGQVYLTAHSMGNVVAGEALRLAKTNRLVNTYVAMEAAVPSQAYDATRPTRNLGVYEDYTLNRYAEYYTNGASPYFAGSAGAGSYVNFYNTNDYAFAPSAWPMDQNLKPANSIGYGFLRDNGRFYKEHYSTELFFPTNTYEIFAFCDEARCNPLGTQPDVGGAFLANGVYQQVDLAGAPYNFRDAHKYHSGQFRSDNMNRWVVWDKVLRQMNLK